MNVQPEASRWSPGPSPRTAPIETTPTVLVVTSESEAPLYKGPLGVAMAHTAGNAAERIEQLRPGVVIVDLDTPDLDGAAVCQAASRSSSTHVLVTTANPEKVPVALRAGCHAVLLKPFAPNLLAARLGRLMRERTQQQRLRSLRGSAYATVDGTNRVWESVACPHCHTSGATGFEFQSHRRMWFACLSCNAVWLGARQE
jgi:CheY-like chemotaxis protein